MRIIRTSLITGLLFDINHKVWGTGFSYNWQYRLDSDNFTGAEVDSYSQFNLPPVIRGSIITVDDRQTAIFLKTDGHLLERHNFRLSDRLKEMKVTDLIVTSQVILILSEDKNLYRLTISNRILQVDRHIASNVSAADIYCDGCSRGSIIVYVCDNEVILEYIKNNDADDDEQPSDDSDVDDSDGEYQLTSTIKKFKIDEGIRSIVENIVITNTNRVILLNPEGDYYCYAEMFDSITPIELVQVPNLVDIIHGNDRYSVITETEFYLYLIRENKRIDITLPTQPVRFVDSYLCRSFEVEDTDGNIYSVNSRNYKIEKEDIPARLLH